MATALVQLDANAQSRFDRSQARAKRLRSLTKDQAGALDTFARDELYEYSGYSDEPYTSLVLKREGWSEPEIESASSAVKADYSHQMAWRFAKQATELAAIFASCQFVARRIPVPVLSLFSRSACVVGLGVPLNSYFLYEAMQSYDEAFRDFFSAVEPHRVMESIASLNGKRVGMELAAVLFPLTLSPRAHVQIANELKNALDGWIARIAVRFPKQFGASKPTSSP